MRGGGRLLDCWCQLAHTLGFLVEEKLRVHKHAVSLRTAWVCGDGRGVWGCGSSDVLHRSRWGRVGCDMCDGDGARGGAARQRGDGRVLPMAVR